MFSQPKSLIRSPVTSSVLSTSVLSRRPASLATPPSLSSYPLQMVRPSSHPTTHLQFRGTACPCPTPYMRAQVASV